MATEAHPVEAEPGTVRASAPIGVSMTNAISEPTQPEVGAPEAVVELKDVSAYYGDFRAVRDVTMPINRHEITAMIGPSGCGKSTVLRSINRMNDLVPGARVEGLISYSGTTWSSSRSGQPPSGTRSRTASTIQPSDCPADSSSGCASPERWPPSLMCC